MVQLYHAICALSALSLACKSDSQHADAFQHYQLALPLLQSSLRSEEDLCNDGVFLSHLILLVGQEVVSGKVSNAQQANESRSTRFVVVSTWRRFGLHA